MIASYLLSSSLVPVFSDVADEGSASSAKNRRRVRTSRSICDAI